MRIEIISCDISQSVKKVMVGQQQLTCCLVRFYLLDKVEKTIILEKGHQVFFDSVVENWHWKEYPIEWNSKKPDAVIEAGFHPGVTDNSACAAVEGLGLLGIEGEVSSGRIWFFWGDSSLDNLKEFAIRELANPLIERINVKSYQDYVAENRFENIRFPRVSLMGSKKIEECTLELSGDELEQLSKRRSLALDKREMQYLSKYFGDRKLREQRHKHGLPSGPTDVELEIIAQTWSEHCKHKIFSAKIDYSEKAEGFYSVGDKIIDGLYSTWIKGATRKIEKEWGVDWTPSVFSDNAGVVRLDSHIDFCIKVETHNSPSALDPYGGALTGILGVNRDILGVGLGARPIANTDVFCLAPPSWPRKGEEEKMPKGIPFPGRILCGVHRGVQDGGNKSGIPTVNGAMLFDPSYGGKPLIFCGTVGVLPQKRTLHRGEQKIELEGWQKAPLAGDRIFMVGGAIGADGIHGATFSSLELDDSAPSTAVQIGDPLTQRRVWDFLEEAEGLFSAITDNGAGGLSSSVGEMALLVGGAHVDLSRCPVKYPGLSPWELMISESQERMTLAVPPENIDSFISLSNKREVTATDIGFFCDHGRLDVFYGEDIVASLDLNFLHHGLPQMNLRAIWDGSRKPVSSLNLEKKRPEQDLKKVVQNILSRENVASKEYWVKRYDQGVQGATHLRPFVEGKDKSSPGNAGVIGAAPHGGEENNGVAIGCGMAPALSPYDPYLMAQLAVDEAVRNVLSVGGRLDRLCLLDNFCWPDPIESDKNPDGAYKLGQLVRSCAGLYDICCRYGTPLVSGKDSMKNDFRGTNRKGEPLTISILPTLLVTAMSQCRIDTMCSSEFKKPRDCIYLLGDWGKGLLGSEYEQAYAIKDAFLPEMDMDKNFQLYRSIQALFEKKLLQSCHDVSEGGLLIALMEPCFTHGMGWNINLNGIEEEKLHEILFNQSAGRFVVSVSPEKRADFEDSLKAWHFLGEVVDGGRIRLNARGKNVLESDIDELYQYWNREWP